MSFIIFALSFLTFAYASPFEAVEERAACGAVGRQLRQCLNVGIGKAGARDFCSSIVSTATVTTTTTTTIIALDQITVTTGTTTALGTPPLTTTITVPVTVNDTRVSTACDTTITGTNTSYIATATDLVTSTATFYTCPAGLISSQIVDMYKRQSNLSSTSTLPACYTSFVRNKGLDRVTKACFNCILRAAAPTSTVVVTETEALLTLTSTTSVVGTTYSTPVDTALSSSTSVFTVYSTTTQTDSIASIANATTTIPTTSISTLYTASPLPSTPVNLYYINSTSTYYALAATAPAGGVALTFSSTIADVFALTPSGLLADLTQSGDFLSEEAPAVVPWLFLTDQAMVSLTPTWGVCGGVLQGAYPGEVGRDVTAICRWNGTGYLSLGMEGNFTGTGVCEVVELMFE